MAVASKEFTTVLGGGRTRPRALLALIALALGCVGVAVVVRFPIWAAVDERAHYAYVQSVAEDQRLPVIYDPVSPEVQAITDRTWPKRSPIAPRSVGLTGHNYEAFQPPLYYVLAAPAFAVVPDHRQKVFAVRGFDLLLVGTAAVVLALLAQALCAGRERASVLAAGLLTLAWPGLLVRGVTISSAALELALASAFLFAAWQATQLRRPRWLVGAALLLGLCLLTKLTLVILAPVLLVPLVAIARHEPTRSGRLRTLAVLALPAAVMAPWLVSNHARFGSWTANAAAQAQQSQLLYPGGAPDWDLDDLPSYFRVLLNGALPQEWAAQLNVWWVGLAARGLVVLLIAVAIALLVSGPRATRRQVAFFALPLVAGLALQTWILLVSSWDIFLLRYLQPALPALAIAVAAALARRRPGWLRAGVLVVAVITAAIWVDMAGAYLFTDVGDRLGI